MSSRKKQTIVYVVPTFATGGAEMLVLQYAQALDPKQYTVHVMSMVSGGELLSSFEALPHVSVFVGDRSRYGGRRGVLRAATAYIQTACPDIVHTHLFGGDFWGKQLVRSLTKRPTWIVTLHNVEHATGWFRRWIWKRVLQQADTIIAVSDVVFEYSKKVFGVGSHMVTITNGIVLAPWTALPYKKVTQEVQIATVGRLTEQKGHVYLFDALSRVQGENWQLHIYGEGALRMTLEQKAKSHGIETHIVWHGVTPDMPQALSSVDLVVQPSLWEGMSLVVMEAMAAGKCVVASEAAGKGMITHTENGYLVPTKESEPLAAVLESLLQDTKQISCVQKKARAYARSHFDFSDHVADVQSLYASFLVARSM